MMYRGVPGTGTPLITDLDEPPATGPILGYSHQAIANLYTYARNDPINLVDPSGLDPEFMTREWFQWFARWDIPSYQLKKNPEWDARLTREADQLFDEVDAIAKKERPNLPTAEARRQTLLAIRAYNEQHSQGIGAIHVDSNADPGQARTNAQTEMEENMILAGEGWWMRQFHTFVLPGSVNPNPVKFDTLIAGVAAGRVAQAGLKRVAVQTPLSPNATPKGDSQAVVAAPALRGVWDKGPAVRGELIEQRLGQNLPKTFPVIDKLENGIVTSIKSMDLWTQTFRNPENITRTGRGYIDRVADFKGATRDRVTVRESQIRVRALDLAIPPEPSPAQQQALKELIKYGVKKGVFVNIVTINNE